MFIAPKMHSIVWGKAEKMTANKHSFLELPSPFSAERGVMLFHENQDADRDTLLSQVLSGQYNKPFVVDDGDTRTLYFSFAYEQSVMSLCKPTCLKALYTRKMMSFLLFQHQPRRLLMLGLGGGSLVKYCHANLPLSSITVVELDPDVIAFRDHFHIPPDDYRLKVIQDDAADYVARCRDFPDVIMIDAFDREGFSPSLCNREFYENVRAALPHRGLAVANLAGKREARGAHLKMIRSVFGSNVLLLSVTEDGNDVVIAFRDACFEPQWRWIACQAKTLESRHNLNFQRFADKLERGKKLAYVDRFFAKLNQPT
jgi:spermidine synthase